MKKLHIIFGLGIFLFAFQLSAQVTIITPTLEVDEDATVEVNIQVTSFNEIVSMQGTFTWDPNVLEYQTVSNFELPTTMTTGFHFGTNNSESGILTFAWIEEMLSGYTLNDSANIFTIVFKAVGDPNAMTDLGFTGDPTIIEITDAAGNVLDVTVDVGTVKIVGPNSTNQIDRKEFTLYQNSPNPFRNHTTIRFFIKNRTEARLSIYDNSGKIIFESNETYSRGMHTIPVESFNFPAAGTYIYELKTEQDSATRSMIFTN